MLHRNVLTLMMTFGTEWIRLNTNQNRIVHVNNNINLHHHLCNNWVSDFIDEMTFILLHLRVCL